MRDVKVLVTAAVLRFLFGKLRHGTSVDNPLQTDMSYSEKNR